MAEEDIVQRVKIVVEDVSFDKAIGDATKKLDAGLKKSVGAYSPSVKVNFSDLDKFNKAVGATTKSAGTTTKAIDGISTALSAMNAVGTAAVTKQLANAGNATKNLVTTTKQAVVEQKNLSKAIAATTVAPPPVKLERDPNTGHVLPRGVKAPPRRGTPEAASFDFSAFDKELTAARTKRDRAKEELRKGTAASIQAETQEAAAINKTVAATKKATAATKERAKAPPPVIPSPPSAAEPERFKPEPRPLSAYQAQPPIPPPPGGGGDGPNNRERFNALMSRFKVAATKHLAQLAKDEEAKAAAEIAKATTFFKSVGTDTGKPEDVRSRYKEELAQLQARNNKARALEEEAVKQKKAGIDHVSAYQNERDERLFKAYQERNLGRTREDFEAAKRLAKQQSEQGGARGPSFEERIDALRRAHGRQPIFGGPPIPPGPEQGPDLSGKLRADAAEKAKKERERIDLETTRIQTDSLKRTNQLKEQLRKQQAKEEIGAPQGPDLSGKLREQARKERERAERAGGGGGAFNELRASLRSLVPVLGQAGVSIGGLGPILTAAGAGAVALGVAITGGLLVAFEKAGDAANDAAQRLGSFTGGFAQGKKSFEGLQELGKTLGTSTSALLKPFEALLKIGQGTATPQDELRGVLGSLDKSMQAERISQNDRSKALTSLLEDVEKNKGLTTEAFESFKKVAPDTAEAIARSLQQVAPGKLQTGFVPAADTVKALAAPDFKAGAEARKLESVANAPESISAAWDHLKAASERFAEKMKNDAGIVAKTIELAAKAIDDMANEKPTLQPDVVKKTIQDKIAKFNLPDFSENAVVPNRFDRFQSPPDVTGGIGSDAARTERLATTSEAAATGLEKVSKASDDAASKFGSIPKQLAAHSALLNKAQAALNVEFLPKEQAVQTARNELNVQRADIAVQSAQIGLKEAQKQQQLAGLAVPQAQIATDQAKLSLEQIRLQRIEMNARRQGIDPDQDPEFLARKQRAENEALDLQEKQAKVNLRRAQIEEKYAHLEEPKAKLAAQQAEIGIRSAEIEAADARNVRAKDAAGQPIARDLALVNYAQAAEEARNKIAGIGEGQLKTLQEILEVLKKTQSDKEKKIEDQAAKDRGGATPGAGTRSLYDPKTGVTTIPWDATQQEINNALSQARGGASVSQPPQQSSSGGGGGGGTSVDPMTSLIQAAEKAFGSPVTWPMVDAFMKAMTSNNTATATNTKAIENNSKEVQRTPVTQPSDLKQLSEDTKRAIDARGSVPPGGLQMDPKDVQKAIEDFRASKLEIGAQPSPTKEILQALGDRSDGSIPGQRAATEQQLNRMLQNQKQIGEVEGKQAEEFGRTISKQLGQSDDFLEGDRAKQRGIVAHPAGGKADLSERLYPGGPLRYRYQAPGYDPPQLGSYDPVTMGFRPSKNQPFPRITAADKYLKGTGGVFDTSGRGISDPIYNYGQPQSLTYPGYRDQLRSELQQSDKAAQQPPQQPFDTSAVKAFGDSLTQAFTTINGAITPLASVFGELTSATQQAVQATQANVQATDASTQSTQQNAATELGAAYESLSTEAQGTGTSLDQTGSSAEQVAGSLSNLDSAIAATAQAFAEAKGAAQVTGSNPSGGSHATGGLIRGPGTGTSNSIPAWLSHGEFVQSARATKYWGADFMRSINSLRMPRFSRGGLAGLMSPQMPRPMISRMSDMSMSKSAWANLGTVDLRTDYGSVQMQGSQSAVDQLSKMAVQKRITSTGRKPGFIG